jgi:hypothetical protein
LSERDPSSPTGETAEGSLRQRIEITGALDRQAAEALQLEIRHLARLRGLEIKDLRLERAPADEEKPSA